MIYISLALLTSSVVKVCRVNEWKRSAAWRGTNGSTGGMRKTKRNHLVREGRRLDRNGRFSPPPNIQCNFCLSHISQTLAPNERVHHFTARAAFGRGHGKAGRKLGRARKRVECLAISSVQHCVNFASCCSQ